MANLIILRGTKDAGKTTTCGLIYENLFPFCNSHHVFRGEATDEQQAVINNGAGRDFSAILTLVQQNITIGIISYGDKVSDLKPQLDRYIARGVHTIICCTHLTNYPNSTFRLIEENYRQQNPVIYTKRINRIPGDSFLQLRMSDVREVTDVILSIQSS